MHIGLSIARILWPSQRLEPTAMPRGTFSSGGLLRHRRGLTQAPSETGGLNVLHAEEHLPLFIAEACTGFKENFDGRVHECPSRQSSRRSRPWGDPR